MAKGDHQRVGNEINTQGSLMQGGQSQSAPLYQRNFEYASNRMPNDYTDITNRFGALGGSSGRQALDSAMGTFGSIATTGGFNEDAIRQRALAPTRAVFDRAISEVDRSRRLGGASPNYAAAQAKLTRDRAYGLSDASVNVEGMMEQLKAQNRLAAASGLANAGNAAFGMDESIPRGLLSAYGTSPGMVGATGNQLLGSLGNQNDIGRSLINARLGQSQVPGNFQQAMGNIGDVLGLGGRIIGGMAGLGGWGGGGGIGTYNPGGYSA